MPSTSTPTNLDRQTAAAEGIFENNFWYIKILLIKGVWAFHIAKHAQSFRSADCVSTLLSKICPDSKIAQKFSSQSDKTAAIISG
jgi:hypothetical protein